jgi:TPR repeat protein
VFDLGWDVKMKRIFTATALGLSLLVASSGAVVAQDFEKGFAAFEKKDYAASLREWRFLASQGHAYAQYNLGLMYYKGQGVTQDYKEAARLWGLAAAQGVARAQLNLGLMYSKGQGVIQDYKEAARLWGLAAAQGDANAQYNLGGLYYDGKGVIQDNVYSHMWLNIAASGGDAEAVNNRDIVTKSMTAADISKAQELARACVAKHYKGC